MDRIRIYNNLAKYFSGESSPGEIDEINRWLNADPGNKILFDEIKGIWESSKPLSKSFNTDEAWQKVKQGKTNLNKADQSKNLSNGFRWYSNPLLLKIAASLILLVLITFYVASQYSSSEISISNTSKEISADNNEIRKIRLSDGTVVTLNSESELFVPDDFGVSQRNITLKGEAYFEVAHNKAIPFFVNTSSAVIKVVGTKFTVTAWDEDAEVSVAVSEGKVNFRSINNDEDVYLSGNEMSTVIGDKSPTKPISIDVKKYFFFWINDELNFYNASFKSVIHRLEMKYNVDIEVEDISILSKHLTANFKDEELSQVLNTISIALNLGYSVNKNKVVFNYLRDYKMN